MENKEIWRPSPLKEYEGFYEVSSLGRIKSLGRNVKQNGYKVFYLGRKNEEILSTFSRKKYLGVLMYNKDGVRTKQSVHRLVSLAFPEICGTPFPSAEVMHLDDNPHNNVATNLRWGTRRENACWNDLPKRTQQKLINGKLSKPVLQYTLDGEFVAEYPSGAEAQRQTGFAKGNISHCCRGDCTYAYGYIWRYE